MMVVENIAAIEARKHEVASVNDYKSGELLDIKLVALIDQVC
jgi:hypothetical protein